MNANQREWGKKHIRVHSRLFAAIISAGLAFGQTPEAPRNVVIYREAGRFGGWPANHGIWEWGNEILVGFSAAYFQWKGPDRHPYDNKRPEEPRLARSLDGGETWKIEAPAELLRPSEGGAAARELDEPMDFAAPGFALKMWFGDANKGPSWFWYSSDRGHRWRGPFGFPALGQPAVMARTDYLVEGPRDAMVFLTAAKKNGREGRVFCTRTEDGGLHWRLVSWVGEEPAGFAIMPSTVRIGPRRLVTAMRVKEDQEHSGIDVYGSEDGGASWRRLARATGTTGAFSGNPPSLVRLRDGRLCVTYGVRTAPFGIRARLSRDEGRTWSREIVVRGDAAAWDVGYTRTVQRPDGKMVTVYYFPEQARTERIIAATIWDPGKDK